MVWGLFCKTKDIGRGYTQINAEERKKRNLTTEKHGESQRIETRIIIEGLKN